MDLRKHCNLNSFSVLICCTKWPLIPVSLDTGGLLGGGATPWAEVILSGSWGCNPSASNIPISYGMSVFSEEGIRQNTAVPSAGNTMLGGDKSFREKWSKTRNLLWLEGQVVVERGSFTKWFCDTRTLRMLDINTFCFHGEINIMSRGTRKWPVYKSLPTLSFSSQCSRLHRNMTSWNTQAYL